MSNMIQFADGLFSEEEVAAGFEAERIRVSKLTPEELEAEFAAFLKTPEGEEFAYGFDVLYNEELEAGIYDA